MGVFDKASLALVPDGIKDGKLYSVKPTDGSGDFTFERGFNLSATRVDENGLIEKGRENLLLNSVWDGVSTDTKPTNWTSQFLSGTGTFDVTSIEGQIRFTTSDVSSRSFIYTPSISINGILTVSVYVDQVYTTCPINQVIARSNDATAISYFEDGVEIIYNTNVQAGKRYSVVFNKTGTTTFRFGVGASSDTLGDIVLSRPQLEQGLVVTDYIKTGASTAQAGILEDLPRIDYTGGTPSLLLEPSRTNLITNSEYFGDYNNSNSTDEANATTSPEGLTNATSFLEAATTGQHKLTTSASFDGSSTYTFSIFAKSNGRDLFIDTQNSNKWGGRAWFDLTNGTANAVLGTANIENFGNGWYRCSVTGASTLAGGNFVELLTSDGSTNSTTGYITKGVFIYGAQLEEGSYPTSYIPTYGAIATRGAESFEKTGLSSVIGQTEGTIFFEFEYSHQQINSPIFKILEDPSNGYEIIALSDFKLRSRARIGNSFFAAITTASVITEGIHKAAIIYKSGDYRFYLDGSLVGSSTENSIVSNPSEINYFNNNNNLKQFLIFPEALSDAECITLTTL